MTRPDVIITQEYVSSTLRNHMEKLIDHAATVDSAVVVDVAADEMAREVVRRLPNAEADHDSLRKLFRMTMWVHKSDHLNFNPREILGAISDQAIEFLEQNRGAVTEPVSQLVSIEMARRRGDLEDWSWTWRDNGMGGNVTAIARMARPMPWVEVSLDLDDEESGSSGSK